MPSTKDGVFAWSALTLQVPGKAMLQTFKYGCIEARMQLPSAGGVWPAFWMLADPSNWPTTGEIDIMEAKHKNPTSFTGTAIGNSGNGPYFVGRSYAPGVDLSAGFHTYALEWGPDVLRFYFDNTLYRTVTPQDVPGGQFPGPGRARWPVQTGARPAGARAACAAGAVAGLPARRCRG